MTNQAITEENKASLKKDVNNSLNKENRSNKENNNERAKKRFRKSNENRSRRGGSNEKEFQEEVLQIDRVTRVVKGGRRLRFRVTAVVGNQKGKVGIGIGKATDVLGGIQKAVSKAKKNIIKVPIIKGTIPHAIKVKFKASRVLLMPGKDGSGLIAGGAVRKVCNLAGIENIVTKSIGTNNKIANAKATIIALQELTKSKKPLSEKKSTEKEEKNKNDLQEKK